MTTKVKALDRLIDAIAGSDVPVAAQTVAGTIDALADTLAGSDVTFTAQDIAGRLDELAKMVEDGTISIGGGGLVLTSAPCMYNAAPVVDAEVNWNVVTAQKWLNVSIGSDVIAQAAGEQQHITLDKVPAGSSLTFVEWQALPAGAYLDVYRTSVSGSGRGALFTAVEKIATCDISEQSGAYVTEIDIPSSVDADELILLVAGMRS